MNEAKINKIIRFMSDPLMQEAVFEVVLKFFMKPKSTDQVNEQAASFIAIGQLQEAWKELARIEERENAVEEKPLTPHV